MLSEKENDNEAGPSRSRFCRAWSHCREQLQRPKNLSSASEETPPDGLNQASTRGPPQRLALRKTSTWRSGSFRRTTGHTRASLRRADTRGGDEEDLRVNDDGPVSSVVVDTDMAAWRDGLARHDADNASVGSTSEEGSDSGSTLPEEEEPSGSKSQPTRRRRGRKTPSFIQKILGRKGMARCSAAWEGWKFFVSQEFQEEDQERLYKREVSQAIRPLAD
jgi:hypothetical protein